MNALQRFEHRLEQIIATTAPAWLIAPQVRSSSADIVDGCAG